MPIQTVLDLQQSVLHMTRVLFIRQVTRDIRIAQLAAKPRKVPSEKRRRGEEHGQDEDRQRGTAALYDRHLRRLPRIMALFTHLLVIAVRGFTFTPKDKDD